MSDVTRILGQIEQGDSSAAEQLLPLVYEELRRLAAAKLTNEKPGQTLQATALVHEAYLRLVDVEKTQHWNSRGHFFGAAAEAMRRILIDRARAKRRQKRSTDRRKLDLDSIVTAVDTRPDDLLVVDEALDQLSADHPECAALVKLRFFAGMSQKESAAALGLPRRTADRQWAFARAWLLRQLHKDTGQAGS